MEWLDIRPLHKYNRANQMSSAPVEETADEIVMPENVATEPSEEGARNNDDVIKSLVEFTQSSSATIVSMQQNISELSVIIGKQTAMINQLGELMSKILCKDTQKVPSQHFTRTSAQEPIAESEADEKSVLSDPMGSSDDQDSLFEKMRARREALSKKSGEPKSESSEQKPVQKDVERAKKLLLDMALQREIANRAAANETIVNGNTEVSP